MPTHAKQISDDLWNSIHGYYCITGSSNVFALSNRSELCMQSMHLMQSILLQSLPLQSLLVHNKYRNEMTEHYVSEKFYWNNNKFCMPSMKRTFTSSLRLTPSFHRWQTKFVIVSIKHPRNTVISHLISVLIRQQKGLRQNVLHHMAAWIVLTYLIRQTHCLNLWYDYDHGWNFINRQ